MRLRSTAFPDGAAIPRRFTCDGEDVSPPLNWTDAPAETRSYALICDDPDAPAGIWHHWAAYDIPPDRSSLPEDAGRRNANEGLKQARNDFGRSGYGGPCPPRNHGSHHYHFRLLALSTDRLTVTPDASCQDVEQEARRHVLAEAVLVGLYKR